MAELDEDTLELAAAGRLDELKRRLTAGARDRAQSRYPSRAGSLEAAQCRVGSGCSPATGANRNSANRSPRCFTNR